MSAGITRVHGYSAAPSQRPSTLSFFNIQFAAAVNGQVGVVNGAIDKIFIAISQFATVGLIGTVQNNGTGSYRDLRFALEDTGTDANSPSGLGFGSASDVTKYTATEDKLQAVIQALGTVNSIALGSATVSRVTI
jgi:hypothetical protein